MKVALSSLRKFLETDCHLKMLKNAFHSKYSSRPHDILYFVLNFVSKNGLISSNVNFKIYNVPTWLTNYTYKQAIYLLTNI